MINIYTEPIPYTVVARLQLRSHFTERLVTIKNLLDYFLFSFMTKVYLKVDDSRPSSIRYNIYLKDLSPVSVTYETDYPDGLNTTLPEKDEIKAWSAGLLYAVNWVQSNRSAHLKATQWGSVGIGLFGEINGFVLNSLRDLEQKLAISTAIS